MDPGVSFNPKNAPVVTPPTDLNGNWVVNKVWMVAVYRTRTSDQPDGGISDDGEDLSDSEKSPQEKAVTTDLDRL
ncbi:MAG: hypothetical protein IPI07_00090 [Flavobacteriales bacterium]|nr:hypothetical protein [Flavobacteriales bacterium]